MNEHNHDEHEDVEHHDHHHGISIQGKFRFAVIFTALVLVFEIIFGIWTHSLALLSDAAHVFADIFSLVIKNQILVNQLPLHIKSYKCNDVLANFRNVFYLNINIKK